MAKPKTLKEQLKPMKKEILAMIEKFDREQEEEAKKQKEEHEAKYKAIAQDIFNEIPNEIQKALAEGEDYIILCQAEDESWNYLYNMLVEEKMTSAVESITQEEDDPEDMSGHYRVDVEYKVLYFRKLKP